MIKKDALILSVLIGGAFPLVLALLAVTLWFYLDKNESHVLYYLAGGLAGGLLIDAGFLKKWVQHRYALPLSFMALLFGIYNLMFYGFFMGFPVFNICWGFMAGWYIGRRIAFQGIEERRAKQLINRVTMFTTLTMVLICIASGYLALSGSTVASEVSSMLGLGFLLTRPMLIGLVMIGGSLLIAAQLLLTRLTAER